MKEENDVNPKSKPRALLELFAASTKLGLTSFGGPIAHLGYFHDEYVTRRKWIDERVYAELVALCQFLPGPASSQVGIGIGLIRAGLLGGAVAWIGFTLPSFLALTLFAFLLQGYPMDAAGWIHGLKIVAVAIVAHAIIGMGQKLTPDRNRVAIAVISATVTLSWQTAFSQVLLIVAAGLIGLLMYSKTASSDFSSLSVPVSRGTAALCLGLFASLWIALPLLRPFSNTGFLPLFDSFYRAGSLVFGGGHVVLPLLEREAVPAGWVTSEDFLAGYGAAQAVPGPLFTFAGYLGAMAFGFSGAVVATLAIFLPAFFMIIGALPFWSSLRSIPKVQGALMGINAAVVGILLAALYDPLWTTAILSPADFALAMILFVLIALWKWPPWIVVAASAAGGMMIS